MKFVSKFLFSDEGATAVEYAVMMALILLACFSAIVTLGQETNTSFSDSSSKIQSAISSGS